MIKKDIDVLIVGGGPAGLAAALELHKQGIENILIIEREKHLGGILRQCIHDGFGLTRFKESLSGPEYAYRFIDEIIKSNIPYITESTVTKITENHLVQFVSREGLFEVQAKAIVLTMGCRERTRGALAIPGKRPAGVYTAGVAQSYINLHNTMVGKNCVILGSGDIGLIMARRLTLEGAKVLGVYEIQDYPSGLNRNVIQCLEDYDIPLYLSHTVTNIYGKERLTGVTVHQVDQNRQIIEGTEKFIETDTLILSVGLIPENELSIDANIELDPKTGGPIVNEHYETSVKGIFSAGNALHVHDLVDFVSMEAENLAKSVKKLLLSESNPARASKIKIRTGQNVSYTVPHQLNSFDDFTLYFRPTSPKKDVTLKITQGNEIVFEKRLKKVLPAEMEKIKIKGNLISSDDILEVSIHD